LIPAAPNDCYAALGKNDQKIYVVPSLDLVVVRQGEASGSPLFALSSFDNELWEHLNDLSCSASTPIEKGFAISELQIFPNPSSDMISISWERSALSNSTIQLFDPHGKLLMRTSVPGGQNETSLSVQDLSTGLYMLRWEQDGEVVNKKFWKN